MCVSCVCILYLWCALSLSDYVVEAVGDVCVQTSSQIPRLADPVVIQPSKIIINKRYTQQIRSGIILKIHISDFVSGQSFMHSFVINMTIFSKRHHIEEFIDVLMNF